MSKLKTESAKKNLIQWSIVLILFAFSMITGSLGFHKYFAIHGESYEGLRHFYRTFQLFTLEGGDDLEKPISWMLHVVRFTAPLTTLVAVLLTLFVIFSDQWYRFRISLMRNHVVIIGMGTKGKNVLKENLNDGEKVLVVEKDPLNPHLASYKLRKPRRIIGDSTNISILKQARIKYAKKVYLLMGDDFQQVTACMIIYDLIKKSKRKQKDSLECIMHLKNQESLHILRNHRLVQNVNDGLSLNVFNVYENAARELYQDNPPDRDGLSELSKEFIQLIIFGFGQAGEALALQSALTGHYLNWNRRTPRVVIFDRMANEKVNDFRKRYPTYKNYCELIPIPMEADSPRLITELVSFLETPDSLSTVVLCFDNRTNNMLLGLQIDSMALPHLTAPVQIFSRTDDNEGFDNITKNIKPYSLPAKVCSKDAIEGNELDDMAIANHANFLTNRRIETDFGNRAADVEWEFLSQEFRDSNRKAADHFGVKMRGIGCQIVSEGDPGPEAVMTELELRLLAELEHRRWNAERSLAGWTYSPVRNDKTRQTPYLVDWSLLDPDIQKYDWDAVENIPNVLKVANLKIVRT